MAIVIVSTLDKLHDSISQIDMQYRFGDDLSHYIAPALTEFFLNAEQSRPLFASRINIYSFSYELFAAQFRDWIDDEIRRNPDSREKIESIWIIAP